MTNERLPVENGKALSDEVTVSINGQSFDGWQNVSISKNLESIANEFSIGLYDRFTGVVKNWPFKPGSDIAVNIGEERVVTGKIEKLDINYAAEDKSFSISGRSNPGDLVDCMHLGPYEYKDIFIDKLAEQLVTPFGLRVFLSVDPQKISKFAIKPDETIFEALDRAARLQGAFFISTRKGNIRLTRAARARAYTSLEQDVNVLEASANYDTSERHDQYIVKGQSAGTDEFFGANASSPQGSAKDLGVKRHRPFIIVAEESVDEAKAKTRAEWEATLRLAKGTRINVRVQGWKQQNGSLWGINQVTRTKIPFLGIDQDLLIVSVNHTTSIDAGKETTMELVDKNAYSPEPELNKKDKDDINSLLGGS
jgi:prophage tail gpP-like protein